MGRVEPSRANAIERGASVPRGKYGNRAVRVDGYRFDSRLEADRYQELKLLQAAGEVRWFTRQVPFQLAPGVTWRADFLVVRRAFVEGEPIIVEDTKGFLTETARVKLALVRDRYGFEVRVLKRADVQRFS